MGKWVYYRTNLWEQDGEFTVTVQQFHDAENLVINDPRLKVSMLSNNADVAYARAEAWIAAHKEQGNYLDLAEFNALGGDE